ncbi:MAG TPA: L,D-transpeptidase, partial [Geobacteraceae bacterium]
FALVPVGAKVTIVNQPVKAALVGDKVFVEIHRYDDIDYRGAVIKVLGRKNLLERVDFARLERAVNEKKGMPVDVTR